jgi:thioredoxin 1
VSYATGKNFDKTVLKSDVPVLVDFYADWCGPCKMLAPILEELARETPKAKIVKVDIDRNSDLAGAFRISSIPTLLVFKDGKVVAQHVGLASKASLKRLLEHPKKNKKK